MSSFLPDLSSECSGFLDHLLIRKDSTGIQPGPAWMYRWNYTHISPLAMAEIPPPSDLPSLEWTNRVAERVLAQIGNTIEIDTTLRARADVQLKIAALKNALSGGNAGLTLLGAVVSDMACHARLNDGVSDRPQTLDDYAAIFRTLGVPAIAKDYAQDSVFGWMRIAGPNPLMIRRIRERMPNFPLSDLQYEAVVAGDSLDAALDAGRVYVCDYKMLDGLDVNPGVTPRKYLYAPIALFAEHPVTGALVPVAIQTEQQPNNARNNLFIADGSYDWLIAKTIVEVADGTVHEPVSHLGLTHLFIEPFVVATGRNLPANHPVCRLLWPHFEGTLFINHAAVYTLVAPGGNVEDLVGCTLSAALEMAAQQVRSREFDKALLPLTFADRDVSDLTVYPYRDDAKLYWDAIGAWVTSYLAVFYHSDQQVSADMALQNWAADLVNNGRVPGFATGGGIPTLNYLTDVLTMIIFTSSVQHAAVNFPQYNLMSYSPNLPMAAYSQFPGPLPATAQDYLDILPTMGRAKEQLEVMYTLGSMHYTQLGQYPDTYFSGPGIPLLNQFQADLAAAGSTIRDRNGLRRPYHTLLPGAIPQSINI